MSRDPIGLSGGLNIYGYVNNDPTNYFDPNGQDPIGAVISSAFGSAAGFFGGMYAGAAVFGVAAIETGPGEIVAVPTGAIFGAVGGTIVGGEIGRQWGDMAGDAVHNWLESKKWDNREGDGTRGLTPDEVRDKYKNLGWSDGEIKKLINEIEKIRGKRNKRKRDKGPPGGTPYCPGDDDDDK